MSRSPTISAIRWRLREVESRLRETAELIEEAKIVEPAYLGPAPEVITELADAVGKMRASIREWRLPHELSSRRRPRLVG